MLLHAIETFFQELKAFWLNYQSLYCHSRYTPGQCLFKPLQFIEKESNISHLQKRNYSQINNNIYKQTNQSHN